MATLGVEIEMAVIDQNTGESRLVEQYFEILQQLKERRGIVADLETHDNKDLAVLSPNVVSSVDNGFNNLESAIGPIPDSADNLNVLRQAIDLELTEVIQALDSENSTITNFSQHPFTQITEEFYRAARSPKPIYNYWVNSRNWNHMAGIDAKAHNGPTTGTTFANAVSGLNILLGLSPALIAIYGNSPFVNGKVTRIKENRQTLWPQMFGPSHFPCDRKLHRLPDRPFNDLRDYLSWMFGTGTQMQPILGTGGGNYKKPKELLRIIGDPSLFDFLRGKKWPARKVENGKQSMKTDTTLGYVIPTMRHLEFQQFSQFLDARIRFELGDTPLPIDHFLDALDNQQPLEELFTQHCKSVYLEGRAAGTNFPDRELANQTDPHIARSVVISVSALQTGIFRTPQKAWKLVNKYGWNNLRQLREAAIKDGLQGSYSDYTLTDLARETLELAASELTKEELWMLAYPFFVLETGKNGADRAIESFMNDTGSPADRIRRLTLRRKIISPQYL